ncbi:oocyte-secreted protein 2 [Grammomys surdaster]|uniref:oocyte-secreted protein 2 n=1 Tax=Grammomys surdaster TaxID=491861 RepID=UPI00109F8ED2|nr:oocyte-secreted protein 2 [Grammomys surdaster]
MGVSTALEILVHLAVLVWTCAWDIDVNVSCSQDWMIVIVSAASQNRYNPYVFPDELVLGQGCPATRIHTYQYDFIYPIFHCGIRTKVISEEIVRFETEMYFRPRNHCLELQIIPLQCSASWKSVWLMPVSTEEDPKPHESFFMTDFEDMAETLGLNVHHAASSLNRSRDGAGITNFTARSVFHLSLHLALGFGVSLDDRAAAELLFT